MKNLMISGSFCKNTEDWNSRDYNPFTVDFYLKVEDLLKSDGKFGSYQYNKITPPTYKWEERDGIKPEPTCYRKEDCYIASSMNTIILDVDDGFTIDEFIQKYKHQFVFAIGTTRSHCINKATGAKNNQNRFRVVIPLGEQLRLSVSDLKLFNKHLLGKTNLETGEVEISGVFPFADQACTDLARVYRGNPNATTYVNYHTSKLFDWRDVFETAMQYKRVMEYRAQYLEENRKHREANGDTFADWCRKNWLTDRMLEALRVVEGWAKGSRTVFLNKKVYGWTQSGFTDDEVIEMTLWANAKSGDPIDERRIQNEIFKSLGIRAF